jgi:hypothetical protein
MITNNQCLRHLLPVILAFTLGQGLPNRAHGATVVAPGVDASIEGDVENAFPFEAVQYGVATQRYQQVYGASAFASFGGPELITQIAFRPDASDGSAFTSTLANVRIDLSTTNAAVDGLSTTFANNVGANDATVYSGSLTLSSADTGPAGGPKAFDIVINLTTPFLYDPSKGNLLLDVRNFGGSTGPLTYFDADNTFGDATSRVYTFSGGVNAATADGGTDSLGLVTQFTATAVPEPGTALFGFALVGVAGISRRRRS